MKTIKLIVAAVALSLVQVAFSDVTFTGGAEGASRDLSLPENWSGTPGASEVVTVDVATAARSRRPDPWRSRGSSSRMRPRRTMFP